jgi:hypothetical protein
MTDHTAPQGWISVEDRMPEAGTDCLVWGQSSYLKAPHVRIDKWDEQHECPVSFSTATVPIGLGWDESLFDEVTHWMPLPASPGTAEAQPATPQEAPPADGGAQKEWRIQQLAKLLQSALRIPAMPFPDPGAHSWQAYAQAVHAAYCAVRFKVINAIADLEKIAQPAQPAVDAARPAAQALSDEQIAVRGRFDVAVALLRECLGPLEVSAAIIESDDGEPMEALIRRAKTFVSAASAPKEPTEPTDGQMPTPELFRKALRMAQREHLNRHPPRYVNDDQADASMSDDATELTDCYRTAMSHGGTR